MKILRRDEFESLDAKTFTLIDVLPKEHYEKLHLHGAINICVYQVSFIPKVKELNLPLDTSIILYGDSNNELDAKAAADKLEKIGFSAVSVLEGALDTYRDSSLLIGKKEESDDDQLLKLEDGTYTFVEQSTLQWSGANSNVKHFGHIDLKQGKIIVKNAKISGEFVIDMNSIKVTDLNIEEGSKILKAHLRSEDFFLSALFPEATYSFKDISSVKVPYDTAINYILEGNFALRGLSKPLSVKSIISKNQERLILTARVELDRTKWNVIYGSSKFFKHLGMNKVFDIIVIDMRLEFSTD
jgi:polyisoprenoid-binding protein YceI/rhodanese-related sulfurtransferase